MVQACPGAPGLADIADDLAGRLRRDGIGAVSAPPGATLPAAGGETIVIALDGCAASCCARALEAQGLDPRRVVLDELGLEPGAQLAGEERDVLIDRIVGRLHVVCAPPAAPRLRRRAPRPRPPRGAPSRAERAHSVGDYLRAIHALASPVVDCGAVVQGAPALSAHISRLLGVSRATSGEMLRRLEGDGLVRRGANREVLLTDAGRAMAERAVRRQRVLECFLVDFLGSSPAEVYWEAAALEATMDDEMVVRIAERLGHPERCPHGWPLDPELERRESRDLTALSALAANERATVVRLAEQDAGLLAWLFERRLVPGAQIEVAAVGPYGETVTALVAGEHVQLGRAAAEAVFVRRAVRAEP